MIQAQNQIHHLEQLRKRDGLGHHCQSEYADSRATVFLNQFAIDAKDLVDLPSPVGSFTMRRVNVKAIGLRIIDAGTKRCGGR